MDMIKYRPMGQIAQEMFKNTTSTAEKANAFSENTITLKTQEQKGPKFNQRSKSSHRRVCCNYKGAHLG